MTHTPKTSTQKAAKRSSRISPPRSGRPARRPGKGTRQRGGAPLTAGPIVAESAICDQQSAINFRRHILHMLRSHVRAAREVNLQNSLGWLKRTLEVEAKGDACITAAYRLHLALECLALSPLSITYVFLAYGGGPTIGSLWFVAHELLMAIAKISREDHQEADAT